MEQLINAIEQISKSINTPLWVDYVSSIASLILVLITIWYAVTTVKILKSNENYVKETKKQVVKLEEQIELQKKSLKFYEKEEKRKSVKQRIIVVIMQIFNKPENSISGKRQFVSTKEIFDLLKVKHDELMNDFEIDDIFDMCIELFSEKVIKINNLDKTELGVKPIDKWKFAKSINNRFEVKLIQENDKEPFEVKLINPLLNMSDDETK
jgi:hypothetical protein